MSKTKPEDTDAIVLAKVGGDARVLKLLEIALTAYKFLPLGMFSIKTGVPTRDNIVSVIESFGFRAERIPWERFPERFHKNRPELALFKPKATNATVEEHWKGCIADQLPDKPKRKARKQ